MAWKDTEGRLWLLFPAEREKPGGGFHEGHMRMLQPLL